MTEKGLSRDACLANNAGIRPLTFDLNPQDIKIHEPGGTSPQTLSCHPSDGRDANRQRYKRHNYPSPKKQKKTASQHSAGNSTGYEKPSAVHMRRPDMIARAQLGTEEAARAFRTLRH